MDAPQCPFLRLAEPERRAGGADVARPGVIGAGRPGTSGSGTVQAVPGHAVRYVVVRDGPEQSLIDGDAVRERAGDVVAGDREVGRRIPGPSGSDGRPDADVNAIEEARDVVLGDHDARPRRVEVTVEADS